MPDDAATDLQSSLEADEQADAYDAAAADVAAPPPITDPVALFRHLDVSGRFHRDGRSGRVFHRGMISLRENVEINSLHIALDGNHVKAHVDRVSPLAVESERASYSLRRALAHNVAGMLQDLSWLLRGREGDHRCDLDCEWVPSDGQAAREQAPLLDPTAGAWSVHLEARVAASLDEARLRAALMKVLGRRGLKRDPLEVIVCDDDVALDEARSRLHGTVVPVTQFPPLHVYLARHPRGDVLMFNLNHAASDGFGALRVLRRIARAYAADPDAETPLDFVAVQDLPVRPAPARVPVLLRYYKRAIERLRDLRDQPAQLAADGPSDRPGVGFHLVSLSAQETRQVVDVEHTRASTNVLTAALHVATADWNEQHDVSGRRIGVLVQADLRPVQWPQDTLGNFSVTARMSTTRRDRASPRRTLRAITGQIARNKRTRTGTALIASLESTGLLALWAKQSIVVLQPLTGNNKVDTSVLCNVGSLDTVPSFGRDVGEVEDLWLSTPARAPLSLCLGAVTVGGRLHLTFRYPHRLFSPDAARRFADSYLEHVRSVAADTADG